MTRSREISEKERKFSLAFLWDILKQTTYIPEGHSLEVYDFPRFGFLSTFDALGRCREVGSGNRTLPPSSLMLLL